MIKPTSNIMDTTNGDHKGRLFARGKSVEGMPTDESIK